MQGKGGAAMGRILMTERAVELRGRRVKRGFQKMKNAKRAMGWMLSLGILIGGLLGLPQGSQAITLNDAILGIPDNTQFLMKYSNFELQVTTEGQTLEGIVNVTTIQSTNAQTFYWVGNGI